ncbi:hypothetical protein [Caballeronia sordidicola]|uniref:Polymer-forming cytoskeletal protein n=1 Tax=Caballeronia sordidicola TaxID=196367 RepID=A0A242N142_CABSO|nr:hypothetical protein [Caballeronia sordidicola]OTP77282.1 hypothetical protein PAMC26577_08470 [Caballeronia sordidicola]
MEVRSGRIDGPFTVERDLMIRGTVVGRATVRSGNNLVLNGTVTSDLVIEPAARVKIFGTVNGTVINQGGLVEIHGIVGAVADTASSSRTIIAQGAVIGGQSWSAT